MQKRIVIAFDSWTGGAENIERLGQAFQDRGFDLLLIHIGSWGHDQGRPLEEHIGSLLVRDILYYKGLSFAEILWRERPIVVLFLSTQAFAHRAFNRYCRQLGIPTLHLYHGVVCVQSTASKRLNPINIRSQVTFLRSRFSKNLFRLWPVYAKALWETDASLRDWFWFGYDVWRQVFGKSYSATAAPDTSTNACCVYTEADISHAAERYGVPLQAIFAVGNPDLEKFGLQEEDIGLCLSSEREVTKDIIYIDTAFIESGAVYDDAEDFVHHLRQTSEFLGHQGFRLVVKLHPAHFRTGVSNRLRQIGIELCDNQDFLTRLKTCNAVIAEPSSAALIPALLGVPLLLAQYGKLSGQEFGKVLAEYPLARPLCSLDDLTLLLADITMKNSENTTRNWLEANAGPQPAWKMPDRVAEVCASVAERNEELLFEQRKSV